MHAPQVVFSLRKNHCARRPNGHCCSDSALKGNVPKVCEKGGVKLRDKRIYGSRRARRPLSLLLQARFNLPVEANQRDPHAIVVALPYQRSAQLAGDAFGRQIVVQAEVALVECFAAKQSSGEGGSYLVEKTRAAE